MKLRSKLHMEPYLLNKYYGGSQSQIKSGVRLPGTAGNYISTTDSVLNSVTGDIDIRVCVKLDDWTPAAIQALVSKYNTASQRAYSVRIETNGRATYVYSVDGATGFASTIAYDPAYVDGTIHWIRFTHDVDNGTGGHDIKYYTSDDGFTWTLRGTQTNLGITGVISLFDSTAPLELGSITSGTAQNFAGVIYYAEVRNGIDGPIVAKFDSSQVQVSGAQLPATINGWTWNGAALYKRDDYVRLPGTAGNWLSYPDTVAVHALPTGDLDLRIHLSVDNATSTYALLNKSFIGGQVSWRWRYVNNVMEFGYYLDGSTLAGTLSSTALGVVAGTPIWLRVTRTKSTGVQVFYTSPDGVTWTTTSTSGAADAGLSLFAGSSVLELGQRFGSGAGSDPLAGNVYYAEVRNGINGPVVASFNGADNQVQTPWTINGAAWNWEGSSFTGKPGIALSIPGTSAGGWASTPDTAGNSVTAAIDVRAKIALDSWADGVNFQGIVSKRASGGQDAYQLRIDPTGPLTLVVFSGGSNVGVPSNVVTGFAAGSTHWVRATYVGDNGASGHTVIYYTSDDGIVWTPLGTAITNAAVKLIDDTTAVLNIGAGDLGTSQLMKGKVYYAEVRNGIDGPIVAKFDPTNMARTGVRTPASTVQPGGTPNMLTPNQASIETDASGWAANDANSTLARSTAQFLDGAASLSITAIAVGATGAGTTPITVVPVVPGKLYTGKHSMRAATAGRTTSIQINWYTAASGFISSSSAFSTDVTTGWTEQSVTAVAPATSAFAVITARVTDATQLITEVHYVDRISLVEAAEAWTISGSAWDLVAA